jgi:hypothetical protein
MTTETEARDLTTFRRTYSLPTQQDYLALLSSPDHERVGREIVEREQAGVARLQSDGFTGSTLAEAYTWWLGDGAEGESASCGCGGGDCGGHSC